MPRAEIAILTVIPQELATAKAAVDIQDLFSKRSRTIGTFFAA